MNIKGFGNITWMTNLPVQHRKLVLKEEYDPVKYPKYDNYEAIEVGRVEDIPMDYDGVMGVPLTIIQYDLDNVEIIGDKTINGKDTKIDGKEKYRRVLIKKNFEIVAKVLGDSVEMVRKHYAVLFDNTVLKEVGDMQKRELEKTIMKILNG